MLTIPFWVFVSAISLKCIDGFYLSKLQTFVVSASWDNDEPITFCVKGQGPVNWWRHMCVKF